MKTYIVLFLLIISCWPINAQKSSLGIEIYNSNIKELLDFQNGQHDLSGITTVKVRLNSSIKSKANSFVWKISDDKAIIEKTTLESVILIAHKPGLTKVSYEVFDASKKSLGTAEIPVSVPLFVRVREYANYELAKNSLPKGVNPIDGQKFDEVLKYAFLLDKKKKILEYTQKIAYDMYKNINIRLVFENLNQETPVFYDTTVAYNQVLLQGFARDYGLGSKPTAALGFAPFQNAFVTMGRVADRYTIFALNNQTKSLHSFQSIFDFFKDKSVSQSRKDMVIPFWQEVFTKILAWTICHELGHTLLPRDYVHTNTSIHPDDLMGAFYDDSDIGLQKKDQIDWRTFPLPGTYKWGKMRGFNAYNEKLISRNWPTTNYQQFNKFYNLNN
jgi:hypothetical protein